LFLEELPKQRAKHEDALLGLKVERGYKLKPGNPKNKIRPKYALLQLTEPAALGNWQTTGGAYPENFRIVVGKTSIC
jgi:hypothetical protein